MARHAASWDQNPSNFTRDWVSNHSATSATYVSLGFIMLLYSSSSCRAGSTDISDPLSPLLPIVHRPRQVFSTSLMSSSLLLQQCPACLVRLTWIVFVIGGGLLNYVDSLLLSIFISKKKCIYLKTILAWGQSVVDAYITLETGYDYPNLLVNWFGLLYPVSKIILNHAGFYNSICSKKNWPQTPEVIIIRKKNEVLSIKLAIVVCQCPCRCFVKLCRQRSCV